MVEDSEFNSGLSLIYQLDTIEKGLVDARVEDDLERRYRILCSYFVTLTSQIKKDDQRENHVKLWKRGQTNIREIRNQRKHKKGTSLELLDFFDYWELEMRQLKQDLGLGMKKFDPRFSMAGRR